MTISIPLTRGLVALIDDEDAHLAALKWYATTPKGKDVSYARRSFPRGDGTRRSILLHRAIMGDGEPGMVIDHLNGDGLDCRRANIAWVTCSRNSRNRTGPRSDNARSPYLGVHYRRAGNIWLAQITSDGRKHHLGCFKTAEDAHAARLEAERRLWGVMPQRADHHRCDS